MFVDHCSEEERKSVSKQESEGLTQVPRFVFSTFCITCVFYLLKMLLHELPELLGQGSGGPVIRNLLSTLYSSCLNVFSVPKFLFNVQANIVGEMEIPTSTLQGETGAT